MASPKARVLRIRLAAIILFMAAAAAAEFAMGRRLWGVSGTPGLWSGDIWSEHNSQYFLDPYTLTHILHGVMFYALLSVAFRRLPVMTRLVIAAGLEAGWEILENSDMVIQRYRTETISLNYYGDSIVNSMGDILACLFGFILASRLPKRVTLIATIAAEILLALWIRDNLTLNIMMLIHPSRAIRMWQLGQVSGVPGFFYSTDNRLVRLLRRRIGFNNSLRRAILHKNQKEGTWTSTAAMQSLGP